MPENPDRRIEGELIARILARAVELNQNVSVLPGTISEITATRNVTVVIDGTAERITAQNLTGRPIGISNRVAVMFVPPHQAFVFGTIDEVVFREVPLYASINGGAELSQNPGTSFRPGTANAAYTEIYRADFLSVGEFVDYDLVAYANAGTMTWQIKCYEDGGSAQVVVGPTTETTNVQRSGTFSIPTAGLVNAGDIVIGHAITVRIEAKLDAGPATTGDIALISLTNRVSDRI